MSNFELTKRENDVMELVAEGLNNKEICEKLVIAYSTLRTYLSRIYIKFGITDGSYTADSSLRVKAVLNYMRIKNNVQNRTDN